MRKGTAAAAIGDAGTAGIDAGLILGAKGDLNGVTFANFRLAYFAMFGAADDTTAQDAAIAALADAFGVAT